MNTSDSGPNQDPAEGGYGAPTPEQEIPQSASENAVQQLPADKDSTKSDTAARPDTSAGTDKSAENSEPSDAQMTPSSEAPLDEDNTDEAKHERESFSSESDADASGAPL